MQILSQREIIYTYILINTKQLIKIFVRITSLSYNFHKIVWRILRQVTFFPLQLSPPYTCAALSLTIRREAPLVAGAE